MPTDGEADIKDLDKVSGWALDNVKASIAAGIITGDQNGYFNPAGATNRVSAAAMLARIPEAASGIIIPNYKKNSQDPDDPNPENLGLINPGGVTFVEDIKISKETLMKQGQVCRENDNPIMAENMERASELVDVPDDVILKMYNKLRPNRSTYEELVLMAQELLEKYHAPRCAKMVLEAAEIYKKRGVVL